VEGSSCTDGTTEACCGETYDSFTCDCAKNMDGKLEYMCMYTDACSYPICETDGLTESAPTVVSLTSTCSVNAPCDVEGSSCTDGTTEACCGETYDSFTCDCAKNMDGKLEYMCMYTDACFGPCETDESPGSAFIISDGTPTTASPTSTCAANALCDEEGSSCTDGTTEACCGETYDSFTCDCAKNMDGKLEYMCMYTDACFGPCETDESPGSVSDVPAVPDVTPTTVSSTMPPKPTSAPTKAGSPPATDPKSPDDAAKIDDEDPESLLRSGGIMRSSTSLVASAIVWSLLGWITAHQL